MTLINTKRVAEILEFSGPGTIYNTSVGKGTIDGFVEKFNTYVKI